PTDPLLLLLAGVEIAIAGANDTRLAAAAGELAGVGSGLDLESQRRARPVVHGRAGRRLSVRRGALDVRDVVRRGQVANDGIQKLLNAVVLEGRSAEDRDDLHLDGRGPDGLVDLIDRDLVAREVALQEGVVGLDDRLQK